MKPGREKRERREVVILASGFNGLGAVRSLDAAGFSVIVVAPTRTDLALRSRIPVRKYVVPPSDDWPRDLLRLLDGINLTDRAPILPCSDMAANFLAQNQAALGGRYRLLVPGAEVTRILSDKRLQLDRISGLGVAIPRSHTRLQSPDLDRDLDDFAFPLIIKPRTADLMAVFGAKNAIVRDRSELAVFLEKQQSRLDDFVLQEVIPGGDPALWLCSAVFDRESELRAAFTYQAIGSMPFNYGVTSIGHSVTDLEVIEACRRVGRALDYIGPADIEFMRDPRSGELVFIEINPRLGMNNWFDTRCGVNIPGAACHLAFDEGGFIGESQRDGVIHWNVMGDLIARIEAKRPLAETSRLYLSLLTRRKVWAIFQWSDPHPAIFNAMAIVRDVLNRARRSLERKVFP